MSDVDSVRGTSADPSAPKDRHEPRGRKPNDGLPPSRAREVQRAFRLRRAEHLASLEERINLLESENISLRNLLNLPEASRPKIGSGPTGKGKALHEGGVPMSERVRARKEARERERRAKAGLAADAELSSEATDADVGSDNHRMRDTETLSPRATTSSVTPQVDLPLSLPLPLFNNPQSNSDASVNFNYPLSMPFNIGNLGGGSPDTGFPDFTNSLDLFKTVSSNGTNGNVNNNNNGPTPNFSNMFNMFNDDGPDPISDHNNQQRSQILSPNNSSNHLNLNHNGHHGLSHSHSSSSIPQQSPLTPPASSSSMNHSHSHSHPHAHNHNHNHNQNQNQNQNTHITQPDLLTRLKVCCHLSDSHVVNDPGLLIFATRLCQSFPCQYSGVHPDLTTGSDPEHLMLEESWRALKSCLDPGGEADGENRINTGRMAAELVIRAAGSRGPGSWIVCRYREGMSIKRGVIVGLVQGLGGKFD